ncbi:MAG TPA: flagellar hook basal-body protein [Nitrospirae bacterium]|nr:flagellar hook basal-body protein [Nitrospirota bacterium]
MYKGIYVAMTGAVLRSRELDIVSNNLANVNTTGFKRSSFASRLYPILEGKVERQDVAYENARAMATFTNYKIDHSQGSFKTTGNPLDLAIFGEGFFTIEDAKGQRFFTRNGSFTLNKDGYLVTHNGAYVLNRANQRINIQGTEINISPEGNVFVDNNLVSQIKVAKVSNIEHVADSLFAGSDEGIAKGEVVQNTLEMSNVNPIREMVGIITALKQYETSQKVIQSFDDLAKRTATDIGRT